MAGIMASSMMRLGSRPFSSPSATSLRVSSSSPALPAGGPADRRHPRALPPDFPVVTSLTFLSPTLTLVPFSGAALSIALDAIGPGAILASLFPETDAFLSARFEALLDATEFFGADGRAFSASSARVFADLIPGSGETLVPEFDLGVISVDAVAVPEPSSLLLVGAGTLFAAQLLRSRRAVRRQR
jgi:hypothetical protein